MRFIQILVFSTMTMAQMSWAIAGQMQLHVDPVTGRSMQDAVDTLVSQTRHIVERASMIIK